MAVVNWKYVPWSFKEDRAVQKAKTAAPVTVANNTGQTKQNVLDKAVSSWQATVSGTWEISMWGKILGNTSEFQWTDMANVYDKTTDKFTEQKPVTTPTWWTEWTITPEPVTDTTTDSTTTATQSMTWPQEKAQETLQNNQNVVWWQVWWMTVSQTKQQVLDKAVSSWQVSVDAGGNIISSGWRNLGNINQMDMTQSAIGNTAPNANAPIQQQTQQNTQQQNQDQQKIDNIAPDTSLWLANSPDSPFWNTFWQWAIDNENQLPWYMNERNKIIASSVMLNNPAMKFMAESKRKDTILNDIMDRQEWWIDPTMKDWYSKTVDNINNLINRSIQPYTENDYFGMMLDWSDKNIDYDAAAWNPLLISAKIRYSRLNKYSSMDTTSLSDSIERGTLNKWSQLWNDLLNKGMWDVLNKAYSMYNMKQEAKITNYINNEVWSFDTWLSLSWQWSLKIDLWTGLDAQISEKILWLLTNPDDAPTLWSFLAADNDVQTAKKASRETEAELSKLSDEITAFSDNLKEKVVEKWWEATDDPFLDAYIQEKLKPFNKRLTTLNSKYRNEIAILEDYTDTAKTAFEVKQYNKQMEIKWYEFVLGRLDAQAAKEAAAKTAEQQQSNRQQSFDLQKAQFDYTKSKADVPNTQTVWYDENWKPIVWYYDSATKSWKSVPAPWSTSWVQTGNNLRSSINYGGVDYKSWSIAPGWLGSLGTGKITQLWWPSDISWLDIDGKIGDPLTTPFSGTVTKVWTDNTWNKYIQISDANWNKLTFNHLSAAWAYKEWDLKVWSTIKAWQNIGFMGNSGNVKAWKGWDGSHLDLVWYKSNGTRMSMPELMEFGATGGIWATTTETATPSYDDVLSFNDDVTRRKMKADDVNRIAAAKAAVMKDPNSDISEVMARSAWGKAIGESQSKSFIKFDQAMAWMDAVQKQIKWMSTWPILWKLRSVNPYDTDAQVLKTMMQGLVPTLARWVYGEVWVLTDNDIKLYAKTLPTLESTADVNKAVLAYTLDVLAGWYKSQLKSLAGQWYDVSGMEWQYKEIKWQADMIRRELGMMTGDEVSNNQYMNQNATWNKTVGNTPVTVSPYSRRQK